MDNEKLRKCNELKEAIERLANQKEYWETAIGINEDLILTRPAGYSNCRVYKSHVNFDMLKVLTLDTVTKKLSELQAEYHAL